MNKAIRILWYMGGSFLLLMLAAYLAFGLIGCKYAPVHFFTIPVFFLLLNVIFGMMVKKMTTTQKELSIGRIMGIRALFITLILIAVFISMMLDREHILSIAVVYLLYTVLFSAFETKILLILNKKRY